jgi:uncharacterized protein DUF2795
MTPRMEAVTGWIDGVTFPARKLDLIDAADTAGAPQETVERLQRLERERYESREQLEAELSGSS